MQGRHTPPLSPDVKAPDMDGMIIEDDMVEEIIEPDDSIFESASSSSDDEDENWMSESSSTENLSQEDAVRVYRNHASGHSVFCGSLSKNGELAVTGDENDKAYLWDINTGESILCTEGSHDDSIIFADFNYSDKYVATADMSGGIKLWRISDRTCVWETSLANDITWVKWHPFSDILVAGAITGEVYMLKARKDDCKVFAQGTGDKSETGIILPDGKRAVIGYRSGTIHVIDLKSSTVLSTTPPDQTRVRGHASAVIALDCHMENNLLISVSVESQTILSTLHNGKVICVLQDLNGNETEKNNNVETVAFCKDPTFPAAATGTVVNDECGKIYIWDTSKQTLRHVMEQEGGVVKFVWVRTMLFTAGLDGKLRCFDAKAGQCLRTFSGHRAAIYDLCISSDEKKALTVSDDSTARIFDISSIC